MNFMNGSKYQGLPAKSFGVAAYVPAGSGRNNGPTVARLAALPNVAVWKVMLVILTLSPLWTVSLPG